MENYKVGDELVYSDDIKFEIVEVETRPKLLRDARGFHVVTAWDNDGKPTAMAGYGDLDSDDETADINFLRDADSPAELMGRLQQLAEQGRLRVV